MMESKNYIERYLPLLIFLGAMVLLLPSIWSETSITGSDEYWLSFRTPMEMIQRHEWVTPWVNGEPRLRKPPLLYWAIYSTYRILGINLIAARIWGVLAGAGLALLSCLLSRRIIKDNGLLTGLFVLATMGFAVEGRRAMLDLPVAFFSTAAVLSFITWGEKRNPLLIMVSALTLGCSFLLKGPMGFFFFLTGALPWLWIYDQWSILKERWIEIAGAIVLLLLICIPWPAYMHFLWGEKFSQILKEEMVDRQLGTFRAGSPFSALGGAIGLIFPFTFIMLFALYRVFWNWSNASRENRWLVAWFIASILPFFFMKSFERYMLAVVPVQAVFCSYWLQENKTTGIARGLMRASVILLALLSLMVCGFAGWFGLGTISVILALILTIILVIYSFREYSLPKLLIGTAILWMVLLGIVYPQFGINWMPSDLQNKVGKLTAYHYPGSQPSLLSIRLGYSVQSLSPELLKEEKSFPIAVFVEDKGQPLFVAFLLENHLLAEQIGFYRTFYSRSSWIKFLREDATFRDVMETKDIELLKTGITIYKVYPVQDKVQ